MDSIPKLAEAQAYRAFHLSLTRWADSHKADVANTEVLTAVNMLQNTENQHFVQQQEYQEKESKWKTSLDIPKDNIDIHFDTRSKDKLSNVTVEVENDAGIQELAEGAEDDAGIQELAEGAEPKTKRGELELDAAQLAKEKCLYSLVRAAELRLADEHMTNADAKNVVSSLLSSASFLLDSEAMLRVV
eukprot:TRINITY_DN27989_c0_g1_i6.p1 TRINITY_DN27989_c0_g1~~TRINITY_DN27989_c0_g1_i6.p1  ORF type:complete len:188 (-),score=45.37 TRINITY_DN27989_c0_g1_i6:104-667(-)